MFDQATAIFDRRHRRFFADNDEPRQVWALDRDRGQIVHLPDGAVDDAVRRACRDGRLRCPVRDCPDPRLIAKGGRQRRHHFAHKVAHIPHDSAAVLRTEAVAMLAAWARRYRGTDVSTSDNDELGIVSIRSRRSGRVSELAVTYDPRTEPLQTDHSPTRQLLLGHTRALLLPRSEHTQQPGVWLCGDARLTRQLIYEHGAAIAVNPQQRLVATLLDTRIAHHAGLICQHPAAHPTTCIITDIDACRLDEQGAITTPALTKLRAWQDEHPNAPTGRAPRRSRTHHNGAAMPSRPAEDIDLPVLTDRTTGPHRPDINRVVLSGTLVAQQGKQPSEREGTQTLRVAIDSEQPNRYVDVIVTGPHLSTSRAEDRVAVVHGHLNASPVNGDLAIVADTVELYSTGQPL